MTVYVCADKDIECGDRPENWCAHCPRHPAWVAAPEEVQTALDDALGLQLISIRLQRSLIDGFKQLAAERGIGYQPLMREVLMQHLNPTAPEEPKG